MAGETSKDKIIRTAWDLFYEKGYDATTLNDIIEKAGVAKGTFYYHFPSKDTLLNTLSTILDEQYERLDHELPEDMNTFDALMYLNAEVHQYIEDHIDYRLMASLYSAQLLNEDRCNLLDKNRYYFRLLTRIIETGQRRGEIIPDKSASEIVKLYGLCERALVTDWCMNNGNYSLGEKSRDWMPYLFGMFRATPERA